MPDDDQKLLDNCISGQSFGWESFVDQHLALISRVAEFSIVENGQDSEDADLKQQVIASVFESFAANDFQFLREFNAQSELPTYLTVIAQRQINEFFTGKEV